MMTTSNEHNNAPAVPVAWWIPKAEQFCLAKPSGERPFAKAWEPLYATPAPAPAQDDEFIPDSHAVLVAALDKIVEAHKFNVTTLVPADVHAIAFEALAEYTRMMDVKVTAPAQEVGLTDAFPWDRFPSWLIDHHEGDTITEEGLQQALANMLKALRAKGGKL